MSRLPELIAEVTVKEDEKIIHPSDVNTLVLKTLLIN